jgi:NADPH:quinone reductase-like Zn-dependent oxidoreductase
LVSTTVNIMATTQSSGFQIQAVAMDSFGAPSVLRQTTIRQREPNDDEVLIRVHVAGVNPIDCKTRGGYGVSVERFPAILGWDVSGTVVEVGSGVRELRAGDSVFGMLRFPALAECYAEYVTGREDELARKPDAVTHRSAAAVAMVGLTAWQSLFELANVQAGQHVFVHGGSGGVGHIAIQLARWAGAKVSATASGRNHALLQELGAERVIDYTKAPLETAAADVDVVLDTRGGKDFLRLLDLIRPGGTIVSLLGSNAEGERAARTRDIKAAFTFVRPQQSALERIAKLMASGALRLVIDRVFPLGEADQAHTLVESGHVRGRVLLELLDDAGQ